jgi:DNA-binding transcriptional MerR regulator
VRLYGPSELQRLNIIVTLKTFGMTLAQIRSLLKTSLPPLARVLEMQLRACRTSDENARRKSAWEYLASALQAHAPRAP